LARHRASAMGEIPVIPASALFAQDEGAPLMRPPSGSEDLLLDLAGRIQADGGMPGRNEEERTLATLIALLCFSAEGNTAAHGTFRTHVRRLIAFLERHSSDALVREALERIKHGSSLPGDWPELAEPLRRGKRPDAARARQLLENLLT